MLKFFDPRAEPATPVEPYLLRADLSGTPEIGLLANGFPDSVNFLDAVQTSLALQLPDAKIIRYKKSDATSVLPEDLLETIASECRAVVAAYGHCGSCTTGTVRDAVKLAREGIPAVALVTTAFRGQARFVARSVGMPDIPRVELPHPVAGQGTDYMNAVAHDVVPTIISALRGRL